MSVRDLGTVALRQMANCNLTRGVLAINAAAAATFKSTNPLTVSIGGVLYNVPAPANRALTLPPQPSQGLPYRPFHLIPGADSNGVNKSFTAYVLLIANAAGTVFALQGDFEGRDLSAFGLVTKGDGRIPECPDGYAPIGVIKFVTVAGGGGFTPGVDALDAAAKAAVTFFDVAMVPDTL